MSAAAKSLQCPSCGGSCDSTARACPWCGSRLATVRCGFCSALHFAGAIVCSRCGRNLRSPASGPETTSRCPRCRQTLLVANLDRMQVAECPKCGGVFVDNDSLRRVTADREQAAAVAGLGRAPPQLPADEVRYIPCPRCGKLMNRVNFGRHSGIIVDVCRDHGSWFDAGELVAALEFVAQGGLQESLRKEREQLRLDEQSRMSIDPPWPAGADTHEVPLMQLFWQMLRTLF